VHAVLEGGLAGLGGVRQHGGVHVDDHLVPLVPGTGIEPVSEGRLRHQGKGIGWRFFELDTSHSPNVTAPEALAGLLDRVAAASAPADLRP
jgi:hypothetical protein